VKASMPWDWLQIAGVTLGQSRRTYHGCGTQGGVPSAWSAAVLLLTWGSLPACWWRFGQVPWQAGLQR